MQRNAAAQPPRYRRGDLLVVDCNLPTQANTLQFFLAMHDFPHQTDIFDSVFADRPRTPARGTVFWGWR